LEKYFSEYISDDFTAEMEDKLDLIAEGKASYLKTLKDFYVPVAKDVKEKEKSDKITNLGDADPKFVCPTCGSPMVIKLSRGGKFLSCGRYPACDGALSIDGREIQKDTPLGIHPETGMPIFVKTGRFGPYVQMDAPLAALTDEPKIEYTKTGKIKKAKKPKAPKKVKPRMASIPKEVDPEKVTLEQAVRFLTLPRQLGQHPVTGKVITANVGRFGPYIVHDGDFRSLKSPDNPYDITYERALEKLAEEKKVGRRGGFKKKEK
jgi:DNA topoisomerase-1